MSIDQAPQQMDATPTRAGARDDPVVIEARGVEKVFKIPTHRIDSFKERAVHPFARQAYRELRALRNVSFDVHQGEFFGIVGRNGSGKSTLLKILASIYRADGGSIRMAGRVAPFIELGVGFNPDLTARENVVLNGVMMGLSQREARRRLDAVLDFAELRDFTDLKLKNYSSGMLVRLAFSVMIQAEADVLLIDEVLAVGDAAFQQKCRDVFHDMRAGGRTVVLVTHDLDTVQTYCHRAMLINDGEITYIGDPEEAGRRYLKASFGASEIVAPDQRRAALVPDLHSKVVEAWLEDSRGDRVTSIEAGEPIRLRAVIEARRDLASPVFALHFANDDGVYLFGRNQALELDEGQPNRIEAGQRIRIAGTFENRLMPGRYYVQCWVSRHERPGEIAQQALRLVDFVVFGINSGPWAVTMPGEVEVAVDAVTAEGAGR